MSTVTLNYKYLLFNVVVDMSTASLNYYYLLFNGAVDMSTVPSCYAANSRLQTSNIPDYFRKNLPKPVIPKPITRSYYHSISTCLNTYNSTSAKTLANYR